MFQLFQKPKAQHFELDIQFITKIRITSYTVTLVATQPYPWKNASPSLLIYLVVSGIFNVLEFFNALAITDSGP